MSWAQIPDFYDSLRIVYEERVPVRIRAPDKTERVEDVNVRMSLGRSKEGRGVQVRGRGRRGPRGSAHVAGPPGAEGPCAAGDSRRRRAHE